MKKRSWIFTASHVLLMLFCLQPLLFGQKTQMKKQVLIDIAHGQKFYNDPERMQGMDGEFIKRIQYMTGEIEKSANSVGAEVAYLTGKITDAGLSNTDLLFIHIPSSRYDNDEVKAIHQYVERGGSLFLVMEVDYWATLEQANVNDIVAPFGIRYSNEIPDSLSGGFTRSGPITPKPLKVTYHGARAVSGGTPFCFSNQSETPFGTFVQTGKGKVVAMGDGMVSLYMTAWRDVNDYQCSEFMHDVFDWLLK